ncbi:hypothetical protein K458DRAFT_300965, partial [Lentithecium fluviatile CBS 122367]
QSMAPIRVSNLERREWRTKCREELSTHIQTRLGIIVEPAQVRLLLSPDNPYAWRFLPEKKHLFSKNISDHSINAYKELYNGVGKTFEAIPAKQGNSTNSLDVSFSALIDQLQGENALLSHAIEEMRTRLLVELERRQQAEKELERLKEVNRRLQEESEANSSVAIRLKGVFDA